MADGTVDYTVSLNCQLNGMPIPGASYSVHGDVELPVRTAATGAIVYGIQGSQPQVTVTGVRKRAGQWSFAAVKQ